MASAHKVSVIRPAYETFVIDLTGDGHGHHVLDTPNVYSHNWHLLHVPAHEVRVGDRLDKSGKTRVSKIVKRPNGDHLAQTKTRGARSPSVKKFEAGKKHSVYRQINQANEVALKHPDTSKGKSHGVPKVHLVEGQGGRTSQTLGKDSPATHRHLLNLSDEARIAIYKENGLELSHPDVQDHELLARIKVEKDPKVKAELIADANKRMEILRLTLAATARADIDTKREKSRDWVSKYDERIRRIPGGRHILNLRDKLLHDKTLDRLGYFKDHGGKVSKDVALRVATATALGLIFGPLGAAAGIAGGAALQEAVHSLLENHVSGAIADHFMEKQVIEQLYDRVVKGAEKGAEAARKLRNAKQKVTKVKKLAGKL